MTLENIKELERKKFELNVTKYEIEIATDRKEIDFGYLARLRKEETELTIEIQDYKEAMN